MDRVEVDGLRDDFTVVARDAPGAGGSSDPPERFGLAGYADCLAGFVARPGLGRPHLAGLSFGGILALAHCGRHPAVPRSPVLAATVAVFGAAMRAFHPTGFRAMARASAEDLRDVLARIEVPTLLLYGDRDVRAPLPVAEDPHRSIPGARLVLLPGAGHAVNIEAPEAFNAAVRGFLSDLPEGA